MAMSQIPPSMLVVFAGINKGNTGKGRERQRNSPDQGENARRPMAGEAFNSTPPSQCRWSGLLAMASRTVNVVSWRF
jgi:hypothetical protein